MRAIAFLSFGLLLGLAPAPPTATVSVAGTYSFGKPVD